MKGLYIKEREIRSMKFVSLANGVDYCGPWYVREGREILGIVYMPVTRAIHLEVDWGDRHDLYTL